MIHLAMSPKFQAQMIGRRIIVWNIEQGMELYSSGFYGKPIGVRKPQLEMNLRILQKFLHLRQCIFLIKRR